MLCYCKKCGRVVQEVYGRDKQICDYCNSILEYIPKQFLIGKRGIALNDELKQQFIDEYIKSSPEFDQFLFEHRDEDLSKRRMENKAKLERGKAILEEQACQPECPTCHSKNVQPISGVERGASIIGLGIFSKKINKSYKCKHCGYTW
jgi:hypothetical protein